MLSLIRNTTIVILIRLFRGHQYLAQEIKKKSTRIRLKVQEKPESFHGNLLMIKVLLKMRK